MLKIQSTLSAALRGAWAKLGTGAAERAVTFTTLALIAFGTFLRLRSVLGEGLPFWLDECDWAMLLVDEPLTAHTIRPIGFMAVSKAMAGVFAPTEIVLRVLPLVAGIAATLMAPFLGKHLFQWAGARLLFVAIIALHPGAIDLSKEFKPYSSGFAIHLALILLAMRYVKSARASHLLQALVGAFCAVIFTQDAVFAYPGVFLVLGITALRAKNWRHISYVSLTAAATVGLVVGLYFLMWRSVADTDPPAYWGNKYDVFYVADPAHPERSQLGWTLHKYFEVTGLPGMRRKLWHHVLPRSSVELVRELDGAFWFSLHALGLIVMAFRRRFYEPLLLLLPLLVSVVFNWLGRFPFGVFRSDMFLLAYVAPLAAMGLDRPSPQGARWSALAPATLAVLLPLFALERGWHKEKAFFALTGSMPLAIERLLELDRHSGISPPSRVLMNPWLCPQWKYYARYHPRYAQLIKQSRGFDVECSKEGENYARFVRRRVRRAKEPLWILNENSYRVRHAQRRALRGLDVELVAKTLYVGIYQGRPD